MTIKAEDVVRIKDVQHYIANECTDCKYIHSGPPADGCNIEFKYVGYLCPGSRIETNLFNERMNENA